MRLERRTPNTAVALVEEMMAPNSRPPGQEQPRTAVAYRPTGGFAPEHTRESQQGDREEEAFKSAWMAAPSLAGPRRRTQSARRGD